MLLRQAPNHPGVNPHHKRSEIINEISIFYDRAQKSDTENLLPVFTEVIMNKKGIASLLELSSDQTHLLRSITNRMALLLIFISDEYRHIRDKKEAQRLAAAVLQSMTRNLP